MSKTIYIAGESRVVDAVNIPKDKDKTGYERFVPEGTVPDGYVPEGTVPDGYVPEGTVPDGYVPEGTVPDGYVPEGTVPDGYVPEGTLPEGAVIPNVVVTDTEAVAPKAFASGTYMKNGMTVSAPGVETPEYDTPTVSVSVGMSADESSIQANASAVANGKTGTGSATKALSAMGLVKPAVSLETKQTYAAGDEIAAGTYLKLGASVAEADAAMPGWIESVCAQTFTPSADTNTGVTFNLTGMSGVPQVIIVGTSQKTPTAIRDYGGGIYILDPFDIDKQSGEIEKWMGSCFVKMSSAGYSFANFNGPTDVSDKAMTINMPVYGGYAAHWRAGQTYTVIAIRLKDLT